MNAVETMKRPIHKLVFHAAKEIGEREEKLLKAVDRARPYSIRISSVMFIINLPAQIGRYGIEPHSHFVQFACALATVSDLLRKHGWEMHRSGGRYSDVIWISEQGASS